MKVGQKVLLVEDDEVLSRSLSEQLELHEMFAMFAVENGAEALQAIKTEHSTSSSWMSGCPIWMV